MISGQGCNQKNDIDEISVFGQFDVGYRLFLRSATTVADASELAMGLDYVAILSNVIQQVQGCVCGSRWAP